MARETAALAVLAIGWLMGLLCAEAVDVGGWQAPLSLAVLAAGIATAVWGLHADAPSSTQPRVLRRAAVLLGLAAFCAGVSIGPRSAPRRLSIPAGMARLEAVVVDTRPGENRSARSVIRVLRGMRIEDGAPVPTGAYLRAGPSPLPGGARVRIVAKLSQRLPFRNPTPHPSAPRRFDVQGSAWIAGESAVQVLESPLLAALLEAARVRVRQRLEATLPPRVAGVARALVLGEGDAIADTDQDEVRDAGLIHVFAVSGLHVAILAGLAVMLLRRALLYCAPLAHRCDVRRVACALGAPLALVYAEFAGGAPSAWRAAVTAALGWALTALGRRPDPAAICAAAVLLLSALDPREATRPAFLLSIAATAAILSWQAPAVNGLRAWVRAAFALSARTWLATAPIVLWCFGALPLSGLFANVLLLPVGTLLLQLAAAHALSCTLTPLSAITAAPLVVVSQAFLGACAAFARLDPGLAWPPPDVLQGLALALSAAALLLVPGARARIAVATAAALVVGALELRLRAAERPTGRLRVLFADVGQGDAALVDLPDGRLMLIDAGGSPGGGPDPGRAALLPLLEARRRARIDIGVITHPHPDHYGGLSALLEHVPITELWDSGQARAEADLRETSAEAVQLLTAASARGTRIRTPPDLCGRAIAAGAARIRVLWPCPGYDSAYDANDNSLVLRVEYGRHVLLFAGDAEQHAETELVARGAPLRADVLKVGHHGSRTSSHAAFLKAVSPRVSVISAGAGNRFGHPHPEVLARLEAQGTQVLNLADTGGTLLESDGRSLWLQTWHGQRFELAEEAHVARADGTAPR